MVGIKDGGRLGLEEGSLDWKEEGPELGLEDGTKTAVPKEKHMVCKLGIEDGFPDSDAEGGKLGPADVCKLGCAEGDNNGCILDIIDGASDGEGFYTGSWRRRGRLSTRPFRRYHRRLTATSLVLTTDPN
jgi:hypothetical protein